MSLIGKRVVGWRGSRKDTYGVVTRVDGIYHCYVLWDDGIETHYETAAIMLEKYYKPQV